MRGSISVETHTGTAAPAWHRTGTSNNAGPYWATYRSLESNIVTQPHSKAWMTGTRTLKNKRYRATKNWKSPSPKSWRGTFTRQPTSANTTRGWIQDQVGGEHLWYHPNPEPKSWRGTAYLTQEQRSKYKFKTSFKDFHFINFKFIQNSIVKFQI